MSTINNTTDTSALSSLASQLFKSVDANNDGQLNAGEFQNFLESLLNKVGSGQTTAAAAASSVPGKRLTKFDTGEGYQGMVGFDYGKLNAAAHTTPKYVFARATQDIPFSWDRASRSAGLQQIADYAKEHGYPNTTVIGDDTMNFGDGNGDIDVLTGDGQWWWGPKGTGA